MKKIMGLVLVAMLACVAAFAQERVGINDTDCKYFAKNYPSVLSRMLNLNKLQANGSISEDVYAQKVMEIMGSSGILPHKYETLDVFSFSLGTWIENNGWKGSAEDWDEADVMLRSRIHSDDYAVMKRNYKILADAGVQAFKIMNAKK